MSSFPGYTSSFRIKKPKRAGKMASCGEVFKFFVLSIQNDVNLVSRWFVEVTNVIRVLLAMIVFVSLYLLVCCCAKLTLIIQLVVTLPVFEFVCCSVGVFV